MSAKDVFHKRLGTSEADKKALEAERLIVAVTERILLMMRRENFSKAELARRLGKSKSFVSATLDGSRNLTLRTLSSIAYALNLRVDVTIERQNAQPTSNIYVIDDYRDTAVEYSVGTATSLQVATL